MVNKKGLFTLYSLIYTILGIGISLMLFVNFQEDISTKYLGDTQLSLIETYSRAEGDIFFINQFISDPNLIASLFENGGFNANSNKMVDEYVLWKKNDSDCYPSQELIGREFAYLFNENLRIEGYPIVYEGKVKIVNSFFEILLNSSNNLNYDIFDKNNSKIGTYSLIPDFKIIIDYDLNTFFNFVENVESVVEICNNDEECWNSHADFEWENNGNLFMFESIPQLIQTANGRKEVKIKAAVDFDEINELVEGEFEC